MKFVESHHTRSPNWHKTRLSANPAYAHILKGFHLVFNFHTLTAFYHLLTWVCTDKHRYSVDR